MSAGFSELGIEKDLVEALDVSGRCVRKSKNRVR